MEKKNQNSNGLLGDVNAFTASGDFEGSRLQCAVYENEEWSVEFLLEQGAQINLQNKDGLTALHVAARYGSGRIMWKLLSAGADITVLAYNGNTAFQDACLAGNKGNAEILFERDKAYYLNMIRESGKIGVDLAPGESIVDLLIKRGAGVDEIRVTPILDQIMLDGIQSVKDINAFARTQDNFVGTLLQCAVHVNRPELVELLLKNGAQVNIQNKDGLTALHVAACRSTPEVMEKLLAHGANSSLLTQANVTVLHDACAVGYADIVEMLLDANEAAGYINRKDQSGITALHRAADEGHYNVVELLIQRNANLNAHDGRGDTPLQRGCLNDRIDIAKLLLCSGAYPNRENCMTAIENRSIDMVKLLYEYNAKFDDPDLMLIAVEKADVRMMKLLEKYGNSIGETKFDSSNSDNHGCSGASLLQIASAKGHTRVVKYLLEKGCDVTSLMDCMELECSEIYEIENVPVLITAALYGDYKMVQLLIDAGASVDACCTDRQTPLYFAAHFGKLKIVEVFLSAGVGKSMIDEVSRMIESEGFGKRNGDNYIPACAEYHLNEIRNYRKIMKLLSL